MNNNNNHNIPFQLQSIIDGMLNKKENLHLRGNYRFRLSSIKDEIEKALRQYDQEVLFAEGAKTTRKRA